MTEPAKTTGRRSFLFGLAGAPVAALIPAPKITPPRLETTPKGSPMFAFLGDKAWVSIDGGLQWTRTGHQQF